MAKRKNPSEEGKKIRLTDKGLAVYLAVKHGVCPKVEGGYDTTNFEKFLDEVEFALLDNSSEDDVKGLKQSDCGRNDGDNFCEHLLFFSLGCAVAFFLCILKSICT